MRDRDLAVTKKENKKLPSLLDRYFGSVYLAACHSRAKKENKKLPSLLDGHFGSFYSAACHSRASYYIWHYHHVYGVWI
jgi:hypothetical protein